MSEHDVMTRLSEANPVQIDDLPDGGPETLLDSILVRRPRSARRRLLLAAAAATAAVAAALVGVFVFAVGGHPQRPQLHGNFPAMAGIPTPPPPRSIAITDISLAVGVPVALPMTSYLQPADA